MNTLFQTTKRLVGTSLFLQALAFSPITIATAASWDTVPLGGGGYVTGLASNTNGSAIYCRTDVGGAYRWIPASDGINGSWVSLSDDIVPFGTAGAQSLMGVESIATDPNNLNRVYIAAGNKIYGSDDQGTNWYEVSPSITMQPNGSNRANGERLAVDPNNSNILWYGSVSSGLQKGVKSGTTWTWSQIPTTAVPIGAANAGISFVVCDKNGTSTIVYAGVKDSTVGGIYCSTDGGNTWTKIGGATLTGPERAQIAPNGTVYLTGGSGGAAKLPRGGTIALMSTLPTSTSYHSVAVDPNDSTGNIVHVATWDKGIWRSTNGGSTWLKQGDPGTARTEPDGTKCLTGYWMGSVASILVNPANSNQLWFGDFFGVCRTNNVQNIGQTPGAVWYTLQRGHEETLAFALKNAPSGPKLMVGVGDVGGARYLDLTSRPTGAGGSTFYNPWGGNGTSLDFSESNTDVWARAWISPYGSGGTGAVSSDGGVTWLRFGEIATRKITNSATGGLETWDVGTYLAKQKAKGASLVTLVISSTSADSNDICNFYSRETTDPNLQPKLVVNGSTNLAPVADAWVQGDNPTANNGASTSLHVRYGWGIATNSRWIYLKFDLSSVASISSAVLHMNRVSSQNATVFPRISIYACSNTTWIEGNGGTDNVPAGELNWNNRPSTYANAADPGKYDFPQYTTGSVNLSGGRIAVSATDPNLMVWCPVQAATHFSTDRGVTWTPSTGAPASQITGVYTNGNSLDSSGQCLASDRVNGNFYIGKFGGASHLIYRSTDGATWTQVGTVSNGGSYNMRTPQLVAAPAAGDLWLCDDNTYNNNVSGGGLWRSTNGGVNWTKISTVGSITAVSFGRSATGTGYVTYIYGFKGGVKGVYRSDDYGATWTKLIDPSIVKILSIAGDRQNYDSLFLGTDGRGTFWYNSGVLNGLVDGAIYELEPLCAPGKRLDVQGVATADGTNVHIWADTNGSNQRWQLQRQTDGKYELIPQHAVSSRLEATSPGTASGTNVQISTDVNGTNQRWTIESQTDGTYELFPSSGPGTRLDVAGAANVDGTNVQIYTDNNTSAQRWKLLKQ